MAGERLTLKLAGFEDRNAATSQKRLAASRPLESDF